MRKILIAIVSVVMLSQLAAQAQPTAQGILDGMASRIASMGNYKVAFSAGAEGNSVDGTYVVSGDKYYMNVTGMEIVCDGKTRYEINHEAKEVLIDKVNPADRSLLANPTKAFDFAGENFKATYLGAKTVYGVLCDLLELKPVAKNPTVTDIVLAVSKSNSLPVELRYTAEGLDSDVVVAVKSFARDASATDAMFRFDKSKYPGYELVDFR